MMKRRLLWYFRGLLRDVGVGFGFLGAGALMFSDHADKGVVVFGPICLVGGFVLVVASIVMVVVSED